MLSTVFDDLISAKVPISIDLALPTGVGDGGYISGVVTELSVPVERKVSCYHRRTRILVGTVSSDANGKYRFNNLIAGVKYFVTSLDENNDSAQYNAVTQDLVVASEVT